MSDRPSSNPSRRESGKSKRGKRRSSRHKNKSVKFGGSTTKTLAKDGLSTFAIFMGFVLACTVFLLILSFFRRGSQQEASPSPSIAERSQLDSDQFDELLESQDLEELTSTLRRLNVVVLQKPARQRVNVHRQRSQLATRMLTFDLDTERKVLAVTTKLDSLAKLESLNRSLKLREPNLAPTLRNFANKYEDYDEPEIQLLARLILIQLETVEPAPDTRWLSTAMLELARDFPRDPRVAKGLREAIEYHLKESSRRANGRILAKAISSADFEGQSLNRLKSEMTDWTRLIELRYFEAWGARDLSAEQLLDAALQMIEQRESGKVLLDKVEQIARWFEQTNQIDSAQQLYQKLVEQSEHYLYTKVAQQAGQLGRDGLARCQAFNQPLNFIGKLESGGQLDNSMLDGQVGLIVFWKTSDKESIEALYKIKRQSRAWTGQAVVVVAVCVDRPEDSSFREQEFEQAVEDLDGWLIVVRNDDGSLPLLEQCPADNFPRIVLTDFQRQVMRIDVPLAEVQTQVGSALIYSRQ